MRITLNKLSALRVMRAVRRLEGASRSVLHPLEITHAVVGDSCRDHRYSIVFQDAVFRTGAFAPDATPRQRWGKRAFNLSRFGLENRICDSHPLYVVVNDQVSRLRMKCVVNTIYANDSGLPNGAFVDLGEGLAISGPELLFAEMASLMDMPRLALLGHELCGSFSRNPDDPRDGDVTFDIAPVTSVRRIGQFLESAKWLRDADRARRSLECVSENAWSPMEAIVSLMANLPEHELGYGMGRCLLNLRVKVPNSLQAEYVASTRVPDILFDGMRVGLNYDGRDHLNLESIVDAATRFNQEPENASNRARLDSALTDVREKAIDDLRRNRELAASGYIVLPVTKEDLYREGGLDRVMAEVCEVIETFDKMDMGPLRSLLGKWEYRARRQQLIRSLLPRSGIR